MEGFFFSAGRPTDVLKLVCSESATAEMRFALALTFVTAVFYEPLRFALTALVPWLEGELPIWHERIDASDG